MTDFTSMLNWKLLRGSHVFPGDGGGTCINEAAVIAAGLEYRQIDSWRDFPECFSVVIGCYAMRLNDYMPNSLRQQLLMPYITRLAGTKDTVEVEIARAHFIFTEIKRHFRIPEHSLTEIYECFASAYMHARHCPSGKLAVSYAADVVWLTANAEIDTLTGWKIATDILNQAILMGKHSTEQDVKLVRQRLAVYALQPREDAV